MLHLSAKRHRSLIWWEDALWKTFWATIYRTDYSIWFIGWVSPYNCEGPVENPSIWKESLTWIVPRIRIVRGENLEGWRTDCRPWGVGDGGRIGNLLEKTQCERGDISQRKRRIYFSNRRWTNQTPWRRLRSENIHLDTAATNSRRKNQKGLFHHLTTRYRVPVEAINDFGSMSGNFINRHHVEPRVKLYSPREESFPYSTEVHWRLQNYTYKIGCYARKPHRWLLEYRWIKRFVWFLDRFHSVHSVNKVSFLRRIYVVREETDKTESDIEARSFMARTLERECQRTLSWGRSINGLLKNQSSINAGRLRGIYFIDPEDKEFKEFKETIKECKKKIGNTNGSSYALQDMQEM